MNLAARIISIVFHPLLMVTYLFLIFVLYFPVALDPLREETHWNFLFLIFGVTFLLPALNIGLFKAFGSIRSFAMTERKERILPFFFITLFYVVVTYLLYSKARMNLHDGLLKFMIVADVLILVATLATLFYKVSIHSLAAWGMIGILVPMNKLVEDGSLFTPTIITLVAAGLIMSARLQLNAHTSREVFVGAILGMAASFMMMSILF